MIPRCTSTVMTACRASLFPVTVNWAPSRRTADTSGSLASRASSSGAEARNRMYCSPPTRLASPDGVSVAITRPLSITATRSHSRSASSMKCVTSTIVTPVARISEIRPHTSRRAAGSSPVVSSSSTATFGLPMSASATDSRCFWPPDSLAKAVSRRSASPSRSISSSASAGFR